MKMRKKNFGSWLSLILAFVMIITTSLVGALPVSGLASTVQAASDTRTIYFSTYNNEDSQVVWNKSNQMYICDVTTDSTKWIAMTYVGEDPISGHEGGYIYSYELPTSSTRFRFSNSSSPSTVDKYTVPIWIDNGYYKTIAANSDYNTENTSTALWTNTMTAISDESSGNVELFYANYNWNGVGDKGAFATTYSKTELGLSTTGNDRTIYFTTMNNDASDTDNVWQATDTMYIYYDGKWQEMTKVKNDELNCNNADPKDGVIWKATISDAVGTEFRFGAVPSGRSASDVLPTSSDENWQTNKYVTAAIAVTSSGYGVVRPDYPDGNSDQYWIEITRDDTYLDVFYNYGTYGIGEGDEDSKLHYNHGVEMYQGNHDDNKSGANKWSSYTTDDVTTLVGTTIYINDIGSALASPLTVTLAAKSDKTDTKEIDLSVDESTGYYYFIVPELTAEDTAGEWEYATVMDKNSTVVFDDGQIDLADVASSTPVYTYGVTRVTNGSTTTNTNVWRSLNTSEEQEVGSKLYVGDTGITSLRIGETDIELSYDTDESGYFEIPTGTTTKTLLIAGATSGSSDTVSVSTNSTTSTTTYYFYWEDASSNEITTTNGIAAVTKQHTEYSAISDLDGIQSTEGGNFILTGDIETSNKYTINGDVVLNLHGKKIITSGVLFEIASGATLTIVDDASDSIQEKFNNKEDREADSATRESSENTYANKGSVTSSKKDDVTTYTVKYYVTESEVNNTTGTVETRYCYTYSTTGAIVTSTDSCVINNSGTLNIQGGLITSNGTALDSAIKNSGTFNMSDGCIAGVLSDNEKGGAGVYSTGTFNMTGGVIANNDSYYSGAGVRVAGGTYTLDGGIISGNRVCTNKGNYLGGGIYLDSDCTENGVNVKVNIKSGYVTNNIVYLKTSTMDDNDESWEGGGGVATKGGTFNMSGGYVTGNYSGNAGGGLFIGQYVNGGNPNYIGTKYKITGGTIASNWANRCEGGGIRITGLGHSDNDKGTASSGTISNADANVYITNNNKNDTYTWGGGGIFVQTGATLTVESALITNNTAKGFGGGVASCPTGQVTSATNDGAAIYSNVAEGKNTAKANDTTKFNDAKLKEQSNTSSYFSSSASPKLYQDFFAVSLREKDSDAEVDGIISLTGSMLGDTSANWSGVAADGGAKAQNNSAWAFGPLTTTNTGTIGKYSTWSLYLYAALTASPSDADIATSISLAGVFITGNTSDVHGAGIMSNGTLNLGTTTEDHQYYPGLTVNGSKSVNLDGTHESDASGYASYFKYAVTPVSTTEIKNIDGVLTPLVSSTKTKTIASIVDSNNQLYFTASSLGTDGTTQYYLYEQTGDDEIENVGSVEYSKVVYKIVVTTTKSVDIALSTKSSCNYNYISDIVIQMATLGTGKTTSDTDLTWVTLEKGTDYTVNHMLTSDEKSSDVNTYTQPASITFNNATFTNNITTPKASLKIIKKWQTNVDADKDGDLDYNEDATSSAYFIVYRYAEGDTLNRYYYIDGAFTTTASTETNWQTSRNQATAIEAYYHKGDTSNAIYVSLPDLNVYVSGSSGTKWIYQIEEVASASDHTVASDGKITLYDSNGSSNGVYYVDIEGPKNGESSTGSVIYTYVVTNRPETYELPLTGSSGWNKALLSLIMLLIASGAIGIYNFYKFKRETKVYATNQEEN